ncbi:DNA topoisomerase I, partial [Rhizobium leguminosarum]|nr:DNA topoisomerase I [Rhizobium leguminosarum]
TRTMLLAQNLYEAGKISYMRTDSVTLSKEAIDNAQQEIVNNYGATYFQERHYKTKSASAQEAHEAIRPTDFSQRAVSQDASEQRLYELIWKRAIASQMADAQLERTTAHIAISTTPQQLVAHGEVVKFDGFLKVYAVKQDEYDEADEQTQGTKLLPPLKVGQILPLEDMQSRERFTKPPARYSEASLVKQLEEQGIGRPSTYAPTITTI